MSNRVQHARQGGQADWQQMTKAERRAAAKAAAARAARAKRRARLFTRVAIGVAGVAALIAVIVIVRGSANSDGAAAPTPSATGASAFPPLPAGADPALAQRPRPGAGSGELPQLKVTPLIEGQGPAAAAGAQVTVNYVGVQYKTGTEFDASWNRSQPFTFQLGSGNVIQGWDQGLVGVRVGSRVQLDIPANLAYGDNPGGGRPAGPLRFVVDLLAVQ